MIDAVGGREIQRARAFYTILENLCISRGTGMPRLKVTESDALNAFAARNERQAVFDHGQRPGCSTGSMMPR